MKNGRSKSKLFSKNDEWLWVCLCVIPQSFPADWDWQVGRWHWTAAVTHLRTPLSLDTPWRVKNTHTHTHLIDLFSMRDVWKSILRSSRERHSWYVWTDLGPGWDKMISDWISFVCKQKRYQPSWNVCYSDIFIGVHRSHVQIFSHIYVLIKQILWNKKKKEKPYMEAWLLPATAKLTRACPVAKTNFPPWRPNSWNICFYQKQHWATAHICCV